MNRSDKVNIGPFNGLGRVLLASVVAAVICGCLFSGDDDEDQAEDQAAGSSTLATIIAGTKEAGGEFDPNAGSAGPGSASGNIEPGHGAQATVAIDRDVARKMLWVHLSRCITFSETDIEAVQVKDEMYVLRLRAIGARFRPVEGW